MNLKPFWRYYGGKWRAAPRYPKPLHGKIIEPFAGAAGYSLRYSDLDVTLVDVYPRVVEIWRYLVGVRSDEILRIPLVESVHELPSWVPAGGRDLVGFAMNAGTVQPCKNLSAGRKKLREQGRVFEGWSEQMRARVAHQVEKIKHWKVREGSFETIENSTATWFIDPPYNNKAGSYYVHSDVDYALLARWCKTRSGRVIVCENTGADWLPFQHLHDSKAFLKSSSAEAIWTKDQASIYDTIIDTMKLARAT